MTRCAWLLLAGCPPGANPLAFCPAAPLAYPASCVETTAPIVGATGYFSQPVVAFGAGTVLDAGSDLAPVDGSVPMAGFAACSSDAPHQVRLLDEGGDTWTFGWGIEGLLDDDSVAAIEPGQTLDFYATWAFFAYSSGGAVVLSDDAGPLFLLELGYTTLDDTLRGFTVTGADGECTKRVDGREKEFSELTFTWTDGSGDLWPGDSVTVPTRGA